jgi:hypothetical protein
MAFQIERGTFGSTSLDGLGFVVVARTPEEMIKGNWSVGLVIDDRASKEQGDAIAAIACGSAGGPMAALAGLIGNFAGVETAPIEFSVDGAKWSVKASSKLDMAGEQQRGLNPNDPPLKLSNAGHPAADVLIINRAVRSKVNALGITWNDMSGNNSGLNAPFSWRAYSVGGRGSFLPRPDLAGELHSSRHCARMGVPLPARPSDELTCIDGRNGHVRRHSMDDARFHPDVCNVVGNDGWHDDSDRAASASPLFADGFKPRRSEVIACRSDVRCGTHHPLDSVQRDCRITSVGSSSGCSAVIRHVGHELTCGGSDSHRRRDLSADPAEVEMPGKMSESDWVSTYELA